MNINVVIVANDGYIQHSAVLLTSLFETNSQYNFRIFLFTDAVSEENRKRLERLCEEYGNSLEIYEPEKELVSSHNFEISELPSGKWSTMIYYKLFMPLILPIEVDRCLFLDVDMVVVDDIGPLYKTEFEKNNIIGGVEDVISCTQRKLSLGLKVEEPYINSGVMVCNITKWREEEKKRPIFDFVKEWSDRAINEQDDIAVYMRGRIQLLPIRWNMVSCNYLRQRYVFPKYYSQLTDARRHPAIHHYCMFVQPWYADCPHPYRHLYKKYLKIYAKKIGIKVDLSFPYKNAPKTIYQKFRNSVGRILNLFDIIKQPGYILHKIRY